MVLVASGSCWGLGLGGVMLIVAIIRRKSAKLL